MWHLWGQLVLVNAYDMMGYDEMRFQIIASRFGCLASCLSLLILKTQIYVSVIYYVVCTEFSKMHLVVWWDCLIPKKFTSNSLLLSQFIVQWLPMTLFVIVLEVGQISLWKVKIWILISRVVVGGEVKKVITYLKHVTICWIF